MAMKKSLHQTLEDNINVAPATDLVPKIMVSAVPIMLMAQSMLLQSLAAWPLPTAPQYTTFLPMCDSSFLAVGKNLLSPPTMKVSVPLVAPTEPENDYNFSN